MDLYFRQPGALQLLTSLYAGRAHHLWRDVTILPWLERNVHAVLDLVDSQAAIIKEAEEKRGRRYQGTPKNIYRHVILSDIKDATTSLPRVNKHLLQCSKIHKKVSFYNKLQSEQRLISNHFLRENSNILKKS